MLKSLLEGFGSKQGKGEGGGVKAEEEKRGDENKTDGARERGANGEEEREGKKKR